MIIVLTRIDQCRYIRKSIDTISSLARIEVKLHEKPLYYFTLKFGK